MTTPPVIPVIRPADSGDGSRGARRWIIAASIALGAVALVAGGGLIAVRELWPQPQIEAGTWALAGVSLAPLGDRVSSVHVVDSHGRTIRVRLRAGRIETATRVRGALRVRVTLTVRRPGWLGWLVGGKKVVHATVRTPAAWLGSRFVYPRAGAPVVVRFSRPVQVISVRRPDGTAKRLTFPVARRLVPIGITAAGGDIAGTVLVAGAPRTWERLPAAQRVSWFPPGPAPQVLVRPAPQAMLGPSVPIVLTFSRPVAQVLGTTKPRLVPHVPGAWRQPNDHTLVFQPSGLGFPLGRRVHLRLPRTIQLISGSDPSPFRTVTWQVPRGSLLRMRQLLAGLGYLPVKWSPAGGAVRLTASAEVQAAVDPPAGTFAWRYAKTPAALRGIWGSDSRRPVLVRGAIMAFQSAHGLTPDGYPSMALFRALIHAQLAGRAAPGGYTYVYVSETLPQTLTLWHNGRVVLRTPVNTGIASRPTDLGTYPVYAHLSSTTMSGTNPDGSHYNDPGVPWVNYFNGGDAVHGFVRGSYGYPQSLGCVEVPIPTAAQIFPYVQVGTLVTVTA